MKKSLLGKLLAGVMSLGIVSGGSFTSNNVIATDVDFEDEDDDMIEDDNVSAVRKNLAKNNKEGDNITSRYSLEFIVKNMINPVWGKMCINKGDPVGSAAAYTFALACGAYEASKEIDVKKPANVEETATIIGKNLGIAHLSTSAISTLLWLAHVDTVLEPLGLVAI